MRAGVTASRFPLPPWAWAGLIVAATLAAYWPSFRVPFFFDDANAIIENPTIRSLRNFGTVLSPPNDGGGATGRPLVNLSLAINYALGGTNPWGYHVMNTALHALAALVLFGTVRRTLLLPLLAARHGAAATPIAGGVALLWALHPLQSESVACVIQRTEVLVGVFYLATFYFLARAIAAPGERRWPVLCVGSALAGMASKEVMVSAPLLLLFFDRTFGGGSFAQAWRLRRSLHLALAGSWLLLGYLLASTGGSRGTAAGFGLGISVWSYLLTQCEAIVLYLKLALWPHPLVIDYGNAVVTTATAVLPQGLLLLALAALTAGLLRFRPALGFLGLWFFAILSPSSSVVPLVTQTIAEHRMYLPLLPVIILLVLAAERLLPRYGAWTAVTAVALGLVTRDRTLLLSDELALWRQCIAHAPDNPRAHDNYGLALKRAGRPAEAIPQYQRALELNPKSGASHVMLGDALLELGRLAEAEAAYRRGLELAPTHPGANNNLAVILHRTGRLREALSHFERALQIETDRVRVHNNLGRILRELGAPDQAVTHFEAALALDPADADTLLAYADLRLWRNDTAGAIALLNRAVQHHPANAGAWNNLGNSLLRAGRAADAVEPARRATELDPKLATAHNTYAIALVQTGRVAEGIRHFERALELDPAYVDARNNLAQVRAALPGAAPVR